MKRKITKRTLVLTAEALIAASVFVFCFAKLVFKTDLLEKLKYNGQSFDESQDFVKIMDVGQADSILIYSNGYCAVVDTGLPSSAGAVTEDLNSAHIKNIDAVVISHLHEDHAGGLEKLSTIYGIKNLIVPESDPTADSDASVSRVKSLVADKNGRVYTAEPGMNFKIGEFEITLIAYYDRLSDLNDRSVTVMAEIDGVKFLLTGDAGEPAESAMINDGIDLDCDVLKVGHQEAIPQIHLNFLKRQLRNTPQSLSERIMFTLIPQIRLYPRLIRSEQRFSEPTETVI
ncbi:MAG: MBL fold metallo-hydrolase [Clostridia bacterium]|nr:MBL fold metallo-hydrolase [Clostridia bacterium]